VARTRPVTAPTSQTETDRRLHRSRIDRPNE
jgi:hypothetical protein